MEKEVFMEENVVDKKICPLCGGENDCHAEKEGSHDVCWCVTTKIPKGLLEKIPQEKRGKACVCKRCVEDYRSEDEIRWDARADMFNEHQLNDPSPIEDQVLAFLEEVVSFDGSRVLDLGGGSGRYAIPLAKRAREVVLTDISSKMLAHAKTNATRDGVDNILFEKLDWAEVDIAQSGMEKSFDLVFASMCPPLRTEDGLEKMIAASGKHCFINQFIVDKDSVGIFFDERLDHKRAFDPHNDRESVSRFFNELWKRNFDPQIRYALYDHEKRMTFEEALEILERDYGEIAKGKGLEVKNILREYQELEGTQDIPVRCKTVSAMIYWEIKEEAKS